MTATFYKSDNGNVVVTVDVSGILKKYSMRPDRDIVPSSDGLRVVIDFYEYSDKQLVFLPAELDFENSFPQLPNVTDVSEAIQALSDNFFFKVTGGGQPVSNSVYVLDQVITAGQETGFSNLLLDGCVYNPLVQVGMDMLEPINFSVDGASASISFNPPLSVDDNVRILVIKQQ